MKEWFKARNIWGAAITALSDEEAGRLAKAIWAFTMDGEVVDIQGAGKGIFAMIMMTLAQDEERDNDISAKRSNAAKSMHKQANASNCMQVQANADNKNKNKNKDIETEQESESSLIADAEAQEYQREQNRVLDAAEDAGFRMSNDVRACLIALYADFGLEKMLEGIRSCVEHDAPNLAYLRAVLKGKPKQARVVVSAQDFIQRDYSGVQDEMMKDLTDEVAEFRKGVS